MSEQKNISTKKVLRFSIGVLLVAVFMVALVAASNQQDKKTIKGLEVRLNDGNEYSFLQKKDIETLLLKSRHINLAQTSLASLDLKQMEAVARTNPWVEKADIYIDNRQVLQVNITQRTPVVRIFDMNGASYYMDSALYTMPVNAGFAFAAPVFTNVPVLHNDSLRKALCRKVVYMSHVISRDSFWRAQVTQVEVQPDQSFVLITLLGNQRILAGDTSRMDEKLAHLFAFYKNVSNKIGWDKYETLDIRYKDQVVASPSIGWIPPKVTDTTTFMPDVPATAPGAGMPQQPVRAAAAAPVQHVAAAAPVAPRPKPTQATAVAKPAPAKVKAATTHKDKPKPVLQASGKGKDARKDVKTDKKNIKTQSPKYIYPGKHSGNH